MRRELRREENHAEEEHDPFSDGGQIKSSDVAEVRSRDSIGSFDRNEDDDDEASQKVIKKRMLGHVKILSSQRSDSSTGTSTGSSTSTGREREELNDINRHQRCAHCAKYKKKAKRQ